MDRLKLLLLLLLFPICVYAQGAGTAASLYRSTFANLGVPNNGSVRYCIDCNANTTPCTGGGTGAVANRVNGAWSCTAASASGGGTVTSVSGTSPISVTNPTTTPVIACATCTTAAAALTLNQLVFGAAAQGLAVSDLTGDITTSGGKATTLKNTGTAGTYRSTTFDAQGRETSGTNPTTFGGYGLSDTSANLRAVLTDENGTGAALFDGSTSATFITPALGTPSALTLTNATGLPLAGLATQAADTAVVNATGGAASPTAVTIGSCSAGTSALTYNTTTHAFGCNSIASGTTINPTNNVVPQRSNATTFIDSPISVSGGNVGLGVTSPTDNLEVVGSNAPGATIRSSTDTQSGSGRASFTVGRGADAATITGWQFLKNTDDSFSFRSLVGGAATSRWTIDTSGNFLAGTDNSWDFGASGAARPRTGYFGTSVVSPVVNATTSYQAGGVTVYSGGTPSIAGNGTLNTGSRDSAGKVTATGTGASTVVLTFSITFTRAPACFVTNETTSNLVRPASTTTTLTFNATVVTGDSLAYQCLGY